VQTIIDFVTGTGTADASKSTHVPSNSTSNRYLSTTEVPVPVPSTTVFEVLFRERQTWYGQVTVTMQLNLQRD